MFPPSKRDDVTDHQQQLLSPVAGGGLERLLDLTHEDTLFYIQEVRVARWIQVGATVVSDTR